MHTSLRSASTVDRAGISFSILSAVLASGCAVDATQSTPPEHVGQTAQALSGLAIAAWGGEEAAGGNTFTSGVSNTIDMGVGNGSVCWLSAVNGNLQEGGSIGVTQNEEGEWFLSILGPKGAELLGGAVCASASIYGTKSISPPTSQESLISGQGSNSWCGLTVIASSSGTEWSSSSSVATVSNNGTNPALGSGTTWTFSESGAFATANCAMESPSEFQGLFHYEVVGGSGGSGVVELLESYPNGAQLPAGTACFLTSIEGSFTTNGFSNGVSLDLSSGDWTMTVGAGKTAFVDCID